MDASKSRKTSSLSFASRSSYSVRTGSEEKCVSFYWNCNIKAEQVSWRQGNARIQFSFFLLLPLLNSQPDLPVTRLARYANDNLDMFLHLAIDCKIFFPSFPLIFTSSTRSIRSFAIDRLQISQRKIHRNTSQTIIALVLQILQASLLDILNNFARYIHACSTFLHTRVCNKCVNWRSSDQEPPKNLSWLVWPVDSRQSHARSRNRILLNRSILNRARSSRSTPLLSN